MIFIMKVKQIQDLDAVTLETLFNQKIMEVYYHHNKSLPQEIEAIHIVQKVWNELLFEDEVVETIKNYQIEKIVKGLEYLDMHECIDTMRSFYINQAEDERKMLVQYYEEIDFEDALYRALQKNEEVVVSFLNIDN